MSSSSDDDEPSAAAFVPRLRRVAEWFTDRNLPYTPRLDRELLSSDYGITSLEEMKVIEISEWQSLLCDEAFPGEEYSVVKWRVFEKEFRKLTAEEFDATKAKPIPIKDTGDAAEVEGGSSKASKRKKRNSGGNQGPAPIKTFFTATSKTSKFDRPNSEGNKGSKSNTASQERAADAAEQPPTSSSPVANKEDRPLIEPHNWRSGRAGVDDVMDTADALERHAWEKSPPLNVLPRAVLKEKGVISNNLEDFAGLYEKFKANRATSDADMADLIKAEESCRRKELAARHPDKPGGSTHEYQKWSSMWEKEYREAVNILGNASER